MRKLASMLLAMAFAGNPCPCLSTARPEHRCGLARCRRAGTEVFAQRSPMLSRSRPNPARPEQRAARRFQRCPGAHRAPMLYTISSSRTWTPPPSSSLSLPHNLLVGQPLRPVLRLRPATPRIGRFRRAGIPTRRAGGEPNSFDEPAVVRLHERRRLEERGRALREALPGFHLVHAPIPTRARASNISRIKRALSPMYLSTIAEDTLRKLASMLLAMAFASSVLRARPCKCPWVARCRRAGTARGS